MVPYYAGMEAQRTAFDLIGQSNGRIVEGLSHMPFAAVPTWDVSGRGTVLSTDGDSGDLLESTFGGDTVGVLALASSPRRPIPPAERADSLKALEARIDSLPVPLDEVVNLGRGVADRHLPEFLPTTVSLRVATGGLIWVERWPQH